MQSPLTPAGETVEVGGEGRQGWEEAAGSLASRPPPGPSGGRAGAGRAWQAGVQEGS